MQGLQRIYAGDSLSFPTVVSDYPATDGWQLHFKLIPRFTSPTQAPIELVASADGASYRTEVAPAATGAWAAGDYGWHSWVQRGAGPTLERVTLEAGNEIAVYPNPETAAQGTDTRSQAERALADCKAALAAWKPTVDSYEIAGRSMRFKSTAEIREQIGYWQGIVNRERAAERRALGLRSRRFNFGRVARA